MPIEIYHINFEIGKREKLPHLFFLKSREKDTRKVMGLKKGEKEQERLFH